MKMKELESRTGVSREAIRFYIREGLLPEPLRLGRNVARYSEEHVARTKLVKRLKEEHHLPLKAVKAVLDRADSDPMLGSMAAPGLTHILPTLIQDTDRSDPWTLEELAEDSGLTRDEIEELAEIGVIHISEKAEVPPRDAEITRLWGAARALGFSADKGYDRLFLEQYLNLARAWAEFEVPHFLQSFAGVVPEDEAAAAGARGVELANRLMGLLHTRFVLEAIAANAATGDSASDVHFQARTSKRT